MLCFKVGGKKHFLVCILRQISLKSSLVLCVGPPLPCTGTPGRRARAPAEPPAAQGGSGVRVQGTELPMLLPVSEAQPRLENLAVASPAEGPKSQAVPMDGSHARFRALCLLSSRRRQFSHFAAAAAVAQGLWSRVCWGRSAHPVRLCGARGFTPPRQPCWGFECLCCLTRRSHRPSGHLPLRGAALALSQDAHGPVCSEPQSTAQEPHPLTSCFCLKGPWCAKVTAYSSSHYPFQRPRLYHVSWAGISEAGLLVPSRSQGSSQREKQRGSRLNVVLE